MLNKRKILIYSIDNIKFPGAENLWDPAETF